MNIEFTARRIKLNPKVREIVETKLEKIAKLLPSNAQAHVIVRAEKLGVAVEMTVVGRNATWTATEGGADQEKATYAVLDRIVAQAKKAKSKVREEKKHRTSTSSTSRSPGFTSEKVAKQPEPSVGARRESVTARPMFEEDALTAFTSGNSEVLVFRDPGNDAFRVLYRRRDGSLGLLIPT